MAGLTQKEREWYRNPPEGPATDGDGNPLEEEPFAPLSDERYRELTRERYEAEHPERARRQRQKVSEDILDEARPDPDDEAEGEKSRPSSGRRSGGGSGFARRVGRQAARRAGSVAGFFLGMVVWAAGLNVLRNGPSGFGAWARAKFLNRTESSPSSPSYPTQIPAPGGGQAGEVGGQCPPGYRYDSVKKACVPNTEAIGGKYGHIA